MSIRNDGPELDISDCDFVNDDTNNDCEGEDYIGNEDEAEVDFLGSEWY